MFALASALAVYRHFISLPRPPKKLILAIAFAAGAGFFATFSELHFAPNAGRVGEIPEQVITQDPRFEEVDREIGRLVDGYGKYLAPDALEIGAQPKKVTYEIAVAPDAIRQINQDIDRLQQNTGGQAGGGKLRVGPKMVAQLTGDGFKIDLQGPSEQPVGEENAATWTWEVQALDGDDWFPKFAARRTLHLAVSAALDDGTQKLIQTYDHDINVTVTWPDWLHKTKEVAEDLWWVWLVLVGGLGGLGGLFALWRKTVAGGSKPKPTKPKPMKPKPAHKVSTHKSGQKSPTG